MRPWLKTGTYGVMHLLVAMTVAFVLSGSWRVALGIGIVEPAVQTLFYTLHERLWRRTDRRTASARVQPARPAPKRAVSPCPCLTFP